MEPTSTSKNDKKVDEAFEELDEAIVEAFTPE
jgi:hypothetical protein